MLVNGYNARTHNRRVEAGTAAWINYAYAQMKRTKYRNIKLETPDGKFDSKREYKRWCDLRLLENAGAISQLTRQVKYPLEVNGVLVCNYIADFVYCERNSALQVVEDSKGMRTREYIIKKKLMSACHGITILET